MLMAEGAVVAAVQQRGSARRWFLDHTDGFGSIGFASWRGAMHQLGISDEATASALFDGARDVRFQRRQALDHARPNLSLSLRLGQAVLEQAGLPPVESRRSGSRPASAATSARQAATNEPHGGGNSGASDRVSYASLHAFLFRAESIDAESTALMRAEMSASHLDDAGGFALDDEVVSEDRAQDLVRRTIEFVESKGHLVTGETVNVSLPAKNRRGQVLRKMFRALDLDGNGDLSYDEIYDLLGPARLGIVKTRAEAAAVCHRMDAQRRGSLRWGDFVRATTSTHPDHRAKVADGPQERRRAREMMLERSLAVPDEVVEAQVFGIPVDQVRRGRQSMTAMRRDQEAPGGSGLASIRSLHTGGGFGKGGWDGIASDPDRRRELLRRRAVTQLKAANQRRVAVAVEARTALARADVVSRIRRKTAAELQFLRSVSDEAEEQPLAVPPGTGSSRTVMTGCSWDTTFPGFETLPVTVARNRIRRGAIR